MKLRQVMACTLALLMVLVCYAQSITRDPGNIYNDAMMYKTLEMYDEAYRLFGEIKTYQDGSRWYMYCEGMVFIGDANNEESQGLLSDAIKHICDAKNDFERLSKLNFEDSDKLFVYCKAREYELKHMNQNALDLYYSELSGVLDSDERLIRLRNGIPLPTQAPIEQFPPRYERIKAHATQTIAILTGPGNDYVKQDMAKVNANSEIYIVGREGNYLMMEVVTDEGLLRFWTNSIRIIRDELTQEITLSSNPRTSYINSDSEAFFGPGEDYQSAGFILQKGTRIIMYDQEEEYTLVEIEFTNQKKMRVWVATDSVNN